MNKMLQVSLLDFDLLVRDGMINYPPKETELEVNCAGALLEFPRHLKTRQYDTQLSPTA